MTRAFRTAYGFGLCIFVASTAGGQVLAPRTRILERFIEDVPVAGWGVVGVQSETTGRSASPSELWVLLPRHSRTSLCVTVTTIDGRYSGRAEYDVSAVAPGRYRLDYQTAYRSELANYRTLEVAVLAELKNRCNRLDVPEAVVVAAWGAPGSRTIVLLVNSMSADRIELAGHSCAEIENERRVAYDWRCIGALRAGIHPLRVRRFFFQDDRSARLIVAIP